MRNPVVCFFEVNKTCVDVFGILPRFLQNLLESENVVCCAAAGMKTTLGIIQLWFNYFATSFFMPLGIYFLGRLRREMLQLLMHSLLSPSLGMGMITPVCQSLVLFQNTRLAKVAFIH